jgi:hypothetical protein
LKPISDRRLSNEPDYVEPDCFVDDNRGSVFRGGEWRVLQRWRRLPEPCMLSRSAEVV